MTAGPQQPGVVIVAAGAVRWRGRRRPFSFPSPQTNLQTLLQAGNECLAELGAVGIIRSVHGADTSDGLFRAWFASERVRPSWRQRRFLRLAEGDAAGQRAIAVKAPRLPLSRHLAALVHAVPGGPSGCHPMPAAMAARAQARVHVHRCVVSIVVLGVKGAGVSVGPGREVLATIQLVYWSGAAGRQGTVRNHHVLRCVVDPLLLRRAGWWCRGQSAVAVYAAVRVS